MFFPTRLLVALSLGPLIASANPYDSRLHLRQTTSDYAPISVRCPSTPLVRSATSIGGLEASYVKARKTKASKALKSWLAKTNSQFGTPAVYPTVGLTSSGGGLRALLCGAGVHQGFDSRDGGSSSTSGLYQALTYEAGLSGGAWLLSSISANNWPTITSLKTGLWEAAFNNSLAVPGGPTGVAANDAQISSDLLAKQNAGFDPTLTDPWGRLISYQLLYGSDGGVAKQISGLASNSKFKAHNVPFPIITALGVKTDQGECLPGPNATQYEFSPYEFGSWDEGVAAFTNVKYLGSNLKNGKPVTRGKCITNYDNQGYILGTSSSLFNEACAGAPDGTMNQNDTLTTLLQGFLPAAHQQSTRDEYAQYPNPFQGRTASPAVSGLTELSLVDGGEALQNNPIWPMLHRGVDVLIVNDNSADTATNFPNGSEILTTYVQAQSAGLTRMPVIPSVDTFLANGMDKKPTFFGCNDASTMTIVYLPNVAYTYMSNQSTSKLQYSPMETDGMIANGVMIANYNGSLTWPTCLGCGIMKKSSAKLPAACTACFQQFCYN